MITTNPNSLSFRSVYKYPYADYTQKQNEGYDYVLNNVLISKKYADKNGQTLKDSFDKLDIDIVAYPTTRGGITFETKNSTEPLKSVEEVNKTYPNVIQASCTSEEQIADVFKTKLENCELTLKSAKKELNWIVGGITTLTVGILALVGAASHNQKLENKAIETTVMQQDTLRTAARDTIELLKK